MVPHVSVCSTVDSHYTQSPYTVVYKGVQYTVVWRFSAFVVCLFFPERADSIKSRNGWQREDHQY